MKESEFVQLMRKKFQKEEMSLEEKTKFGFLINAPEEYETEPEMLAYVKKHPEASMDELLEYFDKITPDGLSPADDGSDLEEDE